MELKPENNTLVATEGNFRVVLFEVDGQWHYDLSRGDASICRGRAARRGPEGQAAVLRTGAKMLAKYKALEPLLGACEACSGATFPFKLAVHAGRPIVDDDWYAQRSRHAAEFFGQSVPPFLVFRCLTRGCALYKHPQRRGA